jgi:hypothetical protein
MIRFQFFPRSQGITPSIREVIDCFTAADTEITSASHELNSNYVLALLRPHLERLSFRVEVGRRAAQKISVLFLGSKAFGYWY